MLLVVAALNGCASDGKFAAFATESVITRSIAADETTNSQRYYLGEPVKTGKDNGFSESNPIDRKDPHYGWKLGRFFVSGFTATTEDSNHDPVFIKTLGDTVTLWFNLEQDVNNLNGDKKLVINEDTNGYDEYFGTERTNFGHGTLIIRHIDYQHNMKEPTIYTDYLVAKAATNADTEIEIFEEGDYEVALDYEIKNKAITNIINPYTNYRIFFKFSVRNGNSMVYPLDVVTNGELTNSSITENGFYLDLAKSRYLDINIKKEVLTEGADGLTEDTRFNRPAKDGDKYTEEGIYTITVNNPYTTGSETTKRIYVGKNNVLKAYVTTNLSINAINEQLALGAHIADDGTIIQADGSKVSVAEESQSSPAPISADAILGKEVPLLGLAIPVAIIIILIIASLWKRNSTRMKLENRNDEAQGNRNGDRE
jgi:hypothetical protein